MIGFRPQMREWVTPHGRRIRLGERTLVMGVLNVTPDSFSDGGLYMEVEAAVARARQMVAEGADLIDIGGESTRPGSTPVSLEEELRRVLPVVEAVRKELPEVPISIDTYKAETARRALRLGADIVNDVWGLKADPEMAGVVASFGCPVVIMHNRSRAVYERDIMEEIIADLNDSLALAFSAGVRRDRIALDPGIGFGKENEHSLEVMRRLGELCALGYPVLLGTSRKRFIRHTLGLPPDDVVEGTAATVALGIAQGCDIVRVHDIRPIVRTVRMTDAVVRLAPLSVC